jgi:DNA polymerase III subunit beta
MLLIKAQRDRLLTPLQSVIGIVERRHTLPILSNVLIETAGDRLDFTATDLEVQVRTWTSVSESPIEESVTLSARKLHDILRALPAGAEISMEGSESRLTVKAGRSRFNLQTLPGRDFPQIALNAESGAEFSLPQRTLRTLLERVQFAMAVQDIRFYLNGTLLSVGAGKLTVVATDGHRLSYTFEALPGSEAKADVIIPRKSVQELIKLLQPVDDPVKVTLHGNQVRFEFGSIDLITKVIDGKFPDYQRVIPTAHPKIVEVDRVLLQQALQRAAILSNEKIRGVRILLTKDALAVVCTNNEQEEAQEELEVAYNQEPLDIGFNIAYLLDVLNHLSSERVCCHFGDGNSSVLVTVPDQEDFKYVVMPMRI